MNLKNLEDLKKACPTDPSWSDIMKAAGLDVAAAVDKQVEEDEKYYEKELQSSPFNKWLDEQYVE